MGINPLTAFATFLGVKSTFDQRSAEKKAAEERKKIGQLEARQYVSELFLAKAQAIDASNRRMNEALEAEKQNTAFFSAKIASSDRSVEAYLRKNRKIAQEDIENIDRQARLLEAKYAAQAATSYTYGQNAAAGMRSTSNANFLSNIADIALNMPPSVSNLFKSNKDVA
tara:strand:- start:2601 stop:3107 length:507 start_codon:yes stop_codon:yes gene_type:complete